MSADSHAAGTPGLYGLMAEFPDPDSLIAAAEKTHHAGFEKVEAYTPFPIEAVSEALGHHHSKVPMLVLIGGILGGLGGFSLQLWANLSAYPMNIAGRPLISWPAFIVPTFECTILGAALSAVFGMFALNGLPMPYHPVFNVPRFARASRDRYFLVIESSDPKFDRASTESFLRELHPSEVTEVEP
jgi:Protein of unknown function (DUF3341)